MCKGTNNQTQDKNAIISFIKEMIQEIRKLNPSNAEFNGQCSSAFFWLEDQEANIWHNTNEELPHSGKEVLVEYDRGNSHDVAFYCKDDNYFLSGMCRIWPHEVNRWAYLEDVLNKTS